MRGRATRSPIVGPPDTTLRRPRLERRLDEGRTRRLTALVAGAGFGKSTLAASWASERDDVAWYALDPTDRSLASLATGVLEAVRAHVGTIPPDLLAGADRAAGAASRATASPADDRTHGDLVGALVCELLDERLQRDLVLVLDDVQEVHDAGQAMGFIEGLVRGAPARLHLFLLSRDPVPFAIGRLRGQGQVVELGEAQLAFDGGETAALLATFVADAAGEADAVQAVTAGWPVAVRLTAEAMRETPPDRWRDLLARLGRPEGPLFGYVAEEVLDREPPETLELLGVAARLGPFDADLLEAVGIADAQARLATLTGRGLFISVDSTDGRSVLHGLIRDVVLGRVPMAAEDEVELHHQAADWHLGEGRLVDALVALTAGGDATAVRWLLGERGADIVRAGGFDEIIAAAALVPEAVRGAAIEQVLGDALFTRGDWDGAIAAFERAAGGRDALPAALAWRLGIIHHERGEFARAIDIFERADLASADAADAALVTAWHAYATWVSMRPEVCRPIAERALAIAERSGDPRAIAAAHLAAGILYAMLGEAQTAERNLRVAEAAAERAGDALLVIRTRNDIGYDLLHLGRNVEALTSLDASVRLASVAGHHSFLALAIADRGTAHLALGHLEQAAADLAASRAIYERLGSSWVCYPLVRLGRLHRLRGEATAARTAYELAIPAAEVMGELQLVEALVGLAQVVAPDEPDRARALVDRAIGILDGRSLVTSGYVGAARALLLLGDTEGAGRAATQGLAESRRERHRAGIAGALEVLAQLSGDTAASRAQLDEALQLWIEMADPLERARHQLLRSELLTGADARTAAAEAERLYRELGVRTLARRAAARVAELDSEATSPLVIQTLGSFRVLRDGEPVSPAEWQSRKARDLLKLLVARRGRQTAREVLAEALWPDEDPGPLANRLSVALTTIRVVLDPERRYGPDEYVEADKTTVGLVRGRLDIDLEVFLAAAEAGRRLLADGSEDAAAIELARAETAYGGDFLEEDADQDWATATREEARATYIEVARSLAAIAERRGDADTAIRLALRILERDPYDEPAHLALVGLLSRVGRHGEARRRYGLYAARMEEIGVEAAPFPAVERSRDHGAPPSPGALTPA